MFREQYELTQSIVEDFVFARLSDDQLRRCPHEGQNSLAWLLWHSARYEDVWTNTCVAGRPQVLDRNKWLEQMNLEHRECGTGWTPEECAAFNARVDLVSLRSYWEAVKGSTRDVATSFPANQLDEVVNEEVLRLAAPDGAFGNERAPVLDSFFSGRTKAWFLALVNLHNSEHSIGEALCVRSQTGIPLGL